MDSPVNTYTATATHEDNWWVLDVGGIGVTQVRRLTEAHAQINGLIEAVTDAPVPDGAAIEIRLAGELGTAVLETRNATRRAEMAQELAASATRSVVGELLEAGISKADVAVVLDVSKQRVSQLAHSA